MAAGSGKSCNINNISNALGWFESISSSFQSLSFPHLQPAAYQSNNTKQYLPGSLSHELTHAAANCKHANHEVSMHSSPKSQLSCHYSASVPSGKSERPQFPIKKSALLIVCSNQIKYHPLSKLSVSANVSTHVVMCTGL